MRVGRQEVKLSKYHIDNNIRASSSAFAWGSMIHTDYSTGCLRRIMLQSQQIASPIAEKYETIGALNEQLHALALDGAGTRYIREMSFQQAIPEVITGTGECMTVSGHADFVLLDAEGKPALVHELKSVSSRAQYRNIFKNGQYKTENLAQLVAYMAAFYVSAGQLIYTYFEPTEDTWKPVEQKVFAVLVDDFGRVMVNDKPTVYTAHDVWAHQRAAAQVVAEKRVGQRPARWDAPFVSPCHFCDHKTTCDAWDEGAIESADAFVEKAKNHIEEKINERDAKV